MNALAPFHLRSPLLQHLHAYWDDQRGDRMMPARIDIDPTDLPRLLSRLILADVLDDPLRFRFRVVGTDLERRLGRRMTGETVGADTPAFYRPYCTCCVEARPTHEYARYDFGPDEKPGEFERLLLPLSDDGDRVSQILGGVVYTDLFLIDDFRGSSPL